MNKAAKNLVFENVSIIDIAEEGKGVGKSNDFVLFVDKAVPGDIADVRFTVKRKTLVKGKIIQLKQASEFRTDAFCEHFGTCGGCKWQHMTYQAQLQFKQKTVAGALTHLAKIELSRYAADSAFTPGQILPQ